MPEPTPRHARAATPDEPSWIADDGGFGEAEGVEALLFDRVHDTGDLPAIRPQGIPEPPPTPAVGVRRVSVSSAPAPDAAAPPLDSPFEPTPAEQPSAEPQVVPLPNDPPPLAASIHQVPPELARLRASIDNFDAALVHLLAERFKCTQRVGVLKAELNLPPSDPARETAQVARLRALATEAGLDPAFAEKFVSFIVAEVIRHHEEIASNRP